MAKKILTNDGNTIDRKLINSPVLKRVVSASGGDYTSLNSAIADIGLVKHFVIRGSVDLSANLAIPSGCTLEFDDGGILNGSYELTGTNTIIKRRGNSQIFSTDVSFNGTFSIDYVTPEMFGAIGDGVTNDNIPFGNILSLAQLTDTKEVCLMPKEYYTTDVLYVENLFIKGNGAILRRSGNNTISAQALLAGELTDFYANTADAIERESWIDVHATLAATLSNGDLIKIISDEIIDPGGEDSRHGEIHKIHKVVENRVYFWDNLFHTYLMSDNARCAKVPVITGAMRDLLVKYPITANDHEVAITIRFAENYIIENVSIENSYLSSLQIADSYNVRAYVNTFNAIRNGNGYGVNVANATMYADISGKFIGHRHCFTTSSAVYTTGDHVGGVCWGIKVHDSVGAAGFLGTACFHMHAGGGHVTFENCTAIGGIFLDYENTAAWDYETSYILGDYVRKNNWFYRCNTAHSNQDPETDYNNDYWDFIVGNDQIGYNTEGLNCTIYNCESINCEQGVNFHGDSDTVIVDGLYVKNAIWGCLSPGFSSSIILVIKNLTVVNEFNTKEAVAIQLLGELNRVIIDNVNATNAKLFSTDSSTELPETLTINNMKATRDNSLSIQADYAISISSTTMMNLIINNVFIENMNILILPTTTIAGDDIVLNNFTHKGGYGYSFEIRRELERLIINNIINDTITSPFIYLTKPIQYTAINNAKLAVANIFQIGDSSGAIYTYSTGGSEIILSDENKYEFYANSRGANIYPLEMTSRWHYRGYLAPESQVMANIGTMYIRRTDGTLYIKQSGSGNTGWVQIT